MRETKSILIHGTCIAQDGAGILIRGKSGAGKSDLALRMINEGARLVADDQVILIVRNFNLIGLPPVSLNGLLEIRGIGIINMPAQASAPIRLVVDLAEHKKIERFPVTKIAHLSGVNVPKVDLWAFEMSAVAKVKIALDVALSRRSCKNDC